ncbi:MAG: hypothetical protein H6983_25330 [Ectothiorhodospiraceae bacterium]|nr:hypothetical protein [Ectothiorhodospiraceae bacterium]
MKRLGMVVAAAAVVAAMLGGCGTVSLAPTPEPTHVTFESPRPLRATYRVVVDYLERCLRPAGYRVRGELEAGVERARIEADVGVGLDRTVFLANRRGLSIELHAPAADGPTVVTATRWDPALEASLRELRRAILDQGAACP